MVLKCENVSKKIGNRLILDNINLEIEKGDIFGFIGPNGSGKTTLIKLILSLQHKTSGKIIINGFDIESNLKEALNSVGAIIENPDFYTYMSAKENLKLKCRNSSKIDEVIKLVGLENRINEKVSTYSLGMKQRLGIAYALLNNPSLLILDEPTNGLDPNGIKELRDVIKKLSKNGVTIFISSHILSELDNICNKVCIIKKGKILNVSNINDIKKINNNLHLFEVSNTNNVNLLFEYEIIDNKNFKVYCNKEFIPLIVESLVKSQIKIYSIKEENMNLETIFLKYFGGDKID